MRSPGQFKAIVETYCPEEKDPFQNATVPWQGTCSPKTWVELHSEASVVSVPANTAAIMQPMDQRIISTSRTRNKFCKAIASIDSNCSDGSGQRPRRRSGYRSLETAGERGLAVEPEAMPEKTLRVRGCCVWTSKENGFSRWNLLCCCGEDAVKVSEMATEDLEYSINLAGKAATGLRGLTPGSEHATLAYQEDALTTGIPSQGWIDFNFERRSTMSNMLPNSITCYRHMVCERKSRSMWQTSLLSYFKKVPQPPLLQPDQSASINIKARPITNKKITLTDGSDDVPTPPQAFTIRVVCIYRLPIHMQAGLFSHVSHTSVAYRVCTCST
ncbi:hypothetical protein QTO34_013175 [Cnephaeus nilssonii]|uniref:Uncharacterized protein n=1 Tax=Cnephaeus nilssonii TaxID=3371016 RepID=A0AA40I7G7_CNENI|nr:hypothetical protein QTO34_013175 [Eptesicus nilssonii]